MIPQRELLARIAELPPKYRAVLEANDFELFAYYGWGVVLNDAQLEDCIAVLNQLEGAFHVWRWANRTGKTTGLLLLETFFVWRKLRYLAAVFEEWLTYRYKVLHAAPLNELAGKAVALADELIARSALQQQNPFTLRQREAFLPAFFGTAIERDKAGVDRPVLHCVNGAKVDFRSTEGGAARLESDSWWLFVWDEFPRQKPVEDINLVCDQTILPRTSDFLSPVILSGTATEDSDYLYTELEDRALSGDPSDWHFSQHARTANFSQSQASINRQIRMSSDSAVAARSVEGRAGVTSRRLFPEFVLANAFRAELPEWTPPAGVPRATDDEWATFLRTHTYWTAFDHGLGGDDNVLYTACCPWPPSEVDPTHPIELHHRKVVPSRRSLTPEEQQAHLRAEVRGYRSRGAIIDSTAEGGLGVYRSARAAGVPAIDCSFNARAVKFVSNKEFGLQALQQLLCWGLDVPEGELIEEWPDLDLSAPFGVLRFPASWTRLRRQLATLKRADEGLRQDEAMTALMLAWHLFKLIPRPGAVTAPVQAFNIMARRRR